MYILHSHHSRSHQFYTTCSLTKRGRGRSSFCMKLWKHIDIGEVMPYLESDYCMAAKDTGQTLEGILEFQHATRKHFTS